VAAEYVKIPELAHRLDVSEKTARRYVKEGKLPSVFIGGAFRVSEEDLKEFLEGAKVNPGKAQAPLPLEFEEQAGQEPGEGRRALYLTTVLEEVKDMTRIALQMRDIEGYGESPQKVTGWLWTITDFRSRVDVFEKRWGDRVLGPLSEQVVPLWERHLLDEIKEELEKADIATHEANKRIRDYAAEHEDLQIKQAAEQTVEQIEQYSRRKVAIFRGEAPREVF
jgi:excisionase family DNA binding protein